ncbi:hypothetical protein DET50_106110 [Marinobacter pelagius]|uniref:Uncharacterized protein n=1 Tax=Marinobacter pelagius TaxID=379482 RepID=A0A366GW15_9GAMM|nr:hypothetical protein [Marinobacter pelagius]RBP31089.1 hypothetical protein DET50_106110 [Marinobacter pelagius]
MAISTEDQRIALEHVQFQIEQAIYALVDKKKELESSESIGEALHVVNLRIDALGKVLKHVVSPLHETYSFIENGSDAIQPGDLTSNTEEMIRRFNRAMLQGL